MSDIVERLLSDDILDRWIERTERPEGNMIGLECSRIHSALVELRSLRSAHAERVEHGWVIEGAWSDPASPQYWAGSSLWVSDHMCAIRFAREHDARQAASAMLDGMNIRICEHVWMPRPTPQKDRA